MDKDKDGDDFDNIDSDDNIVNDVSLSDKDVYTEIFRRVEYG